MFESIDITVFSVKGAITTTIKHAMKHTIKPKTLSVCGVGSMGVATRGYIGYIYPPKISPSKLFVG